MRQHTLHQFRSLHAPGVTRPVIHVRGYCQLAPLLDTGDYDWLEIGTRRVNGSGITGRSGTDN